MMRYLLPARCFNLLKYPKLVLRHRLLPNSSSTVRRNFRSSSGRSALRTQKLGDVGEGITECMLNMWFVEEGAHVEEWDKLCEMQSDKAAVEISANFSGVIQKLYAQADDMVKTGAALVDIDDGVPEPKPPSAEAVGAPTHQVEPSVAEDGSKELIITTETQLDDGQAEAKEVLARQGPRGEARLATPAVRGLLKEHGIDITKVNGTGKDGRVLKEDVKGHIGYLSTSPVQPLSTLLSPATDSKQRETGHPLTPTQSQMYRTMTASLSIPHFLFADEANLTRLSNLRRRLNNEREAPDPHLTLLPFILKAISISLRDFPILNARIDTATDPSKPRLLYRSNHNIGVAMDTPAGLLVPVVANAATLSIKDLAHEVRRLSDLAQARKLSTTDLSGGTISVSNIGSIGGTIVSPLIVEGQVAILGIGKSRVRPVFGRDGTIERAEMANLSWSADHRVVDGATMAKMASMVKTYLEEPERLLVNMR